MDARAHTRAHTHTRTQLQTFVISILEQGKEGMIGIPGDDGGPGKPVSSLLMVDVSHVHNSVTSVT